MVMLTRLGVLRWIAATVALVILAVLTACGSGDAPTQATPPTSLGAAAAPPLASPTSVGRPVVPVGEARLGCGTYCQTAGGYGAPTGEGIDAVALHTDDTLIVGDDGFAPVTITCNLPVACIGAILLCVDTGPSSAVDMNCGRSEQAIEPFATQTFGIPLPTPALGWLSTHGPTPGLLTSDNRGVPECADIPALAAQCASLPLTPSGNPAPGIFRIVAGDVSLAPPSGAWGSHTAAEESASLRQLQQLAADDRSLIVDQLADRWVPQLSSKRPGVVDDGFVWDDTLTLQEHLRLRHRYDAKLVWSGDWSSFGVDDFWVTVAPVTFPDADGALGWCVEHGWEPNYCAAKLISATRPPDGTFAHR